MKLRIYNGETIDALAVKPWESYGLSFDSVIIFYYFIFVKRRKHTYLKSVALEKSKSPLPLKTCFFWASSSASG